MSSSNKHHKQRRHDMVVGGERPPGASGPQAVKVEEAPGASMPSPLETVSLIRKLEEIRNSRVVTLFAYPNVFIREDIPYNLYLQLREIGKVPRLDLFLNTTGGQTEVPWRIITLIRDFCEHFGALVPFTALSAGTHIVMGADEIVMGDMSELSPVDPAQLHALGPKLEDKPLMISVQEVRTLLDLVRQKGDYTPESLATIYSALFEYVNPVTLGAMERSYELGRLVSRKALSTHMNPEEDKVRIEQIVEAFSGQFYSHQYRIGWKEAKEAGLDIVQADDDLWETMWSLFEKYSAFADLASPVDGNRDHVTRPILWLDSTEGRRILQEEYQLRPIPKEGRAQVEPIGARWLEVEWPADTNGEHVVEAAVAPEGK